MKSKFNPYIVVLSIITAACFSMSAILDHNGEKDSSAIFFIIGVFWLAVDVIIIIFVE